MKFAIIENNVIINSVKADDQENIFLESFQTAKPWDEAVATLPVGGNLAPPPPAPPSFISRRKFFQQLAVEKVITQEEALAALSTGKIPPALQKIVKKMPDDRQFDATMMLTGDATLQRDHPFVAAANLSPEFFITANRIV